MSCHWSRTLECLEFLLPRTVPSVKHTSQRSTLWRNLLDHWWWSEWKRLPLTHREYYYWGCGFVGGGVSPWGGWTLRFQTLKQSLVAHFLFLLPTDPDVELSASSLAPTLPAYCHASHHGDNELNLWNYKPALMNFSPLRDVLVMMSLYNIRNPN